LNAALNHRLRNVRPTDRAELRGWIAAALGLRVPDVPHCPGHACPMDYLEHAFFERPGDPVIWANRGGGKTFYGAVATLLDMVFKPGIAVCILGGSFDQSQRMYEYLRDLLQRPGLRDLVDGKLTQRGARLINGSRVELAAQSDTSIRGRRVQKLRCDEVDLFDRDRWRAAQFVTRSRQCGPIHVRGCVEVFSTMHRPFGLMHELTEQAAQQGGWRIMQWCAMDVVARCEPQRDCNACALWSICRGAAKHARGFLSVADILNQQSRSSVAAFESEMLCRRPSVSNLVFPAFDPDVHVLPVEAERERTWIAGVDFGLRNPFVMLWAQLRQTPGGNRIEVIDEYVCADQTVPHHLRQIESRDWPTPRWVAVDPSGAARNEQTGASNVDLFRAAGYRVRNVRSLIEPGIELLRRRIAPADGGQPGLVIHPRCATLIRSMQAYHFDADRPQVTTPVKDGSDHAIDALRYLAVNLERHSGKVQRRAY